MRKITPILIAALMSFFATPASAQGLVINEVLASNTSVNVDEDGENGDWVELFNNSGTAVNLNGFGLSDDAANPLKWVFPNVTMPANSYMLVWCSDKDRAVAGSPLHTNWKISASGETITLSNASGAMVSQVEMPAIGSDISWGRVPNGTGPFMYMVNVTPSAQNFSTGYSEILPPPTMSASGGFYTSAFDLTISTTVPGASIIYTLDGSEPIEANLSGGQTYQYRNSYAELAGQAPGPMITQSYETLQYTGPINIVNRTSQPNKLAAISSTHHHDPDYFPTSNIFKGTVVRAKTVKPGALDSPTMTRTFFVSPAGADEFSLPVVSLAISEDKLFEYNEGIFVAGVDFDQWRAANPTVDADYYNADANYRRTGDPSERPAHLEYFVNGQEVINQDIGLRVNGGATRAWQSKSLRLVARDEYGDDDFDYQFFQNESLDKFNRLLLRNSGSDFFMTMYRDALAQSLVSDFLETQAYQPTITFVNGEYWGILNLRERYDKFYFENVYNIDEDELDLLEDALMVAEGDNDHWQEMAEFMENNTLATQSNFDYIQTQLDVENFRDYYISNIYLENVDWPGWNTEFWRKRTAFDPNAPYGHDGRWRTAMKDTDSAFGASLDVNDHNTLEFATEPNGPEYPNPPFATLVLRSLLTNEDFKIDFINRFADLLNSYLKAERVIEQSLAMKSVIQPEIQEHLARWDGTSYGWWNQSINIVHTFAQERPVYQRDHIRGKFDIDSNIDVTLNVSDPAHGYIRINTIDIVPTTPGIPADTYPWTGIYFSNIPVTLKAVAKDGYVFSHWTGANTSSQEEISVSSANAFSVTAVFVPDTAPAQSEPIYYWMMDNTIPNDTPLTSLNSSFEIGQLDGVINYTSSLVGYPFTSASPNWRKASMERRNNPTPLNYIPEANNNIPFANSNMRGLQITEPLHTGSNQNTMVFSFPTTGFEDIKFAFAAVNEGTNATGILIDYATNEGTPAWTSAGITGTMPLSSAYQVFQTDFSAITAANNNPNFKIRLRFAGTDMEVDNGNRITFNNISVMGTEQQLSVGENTFAKMFAYPNPAGDFVNISGLESTANYTLHTLDGRTVRTGEIAQNGQISLSGMSSGIYLLQVSASDSKQTIKIIKK